MGDKTNCQKFIFWTSPDEQFGPAQMFSGKMHQWASSINVNTHGICFAATYFTPIWGFFVSNDVLSVIHGRLSCSIYLPNWIIFAMSLLLWELKTSWLSTSGDIVRQLLQGSFSYWSLSSVLQPRKNKAQTWPTFQHWHSYANGACDASCILGESQRPHQGTEM